MEFPKLTRVPSEGAKPTVRRFSVRHSPYERPEKDSVRKLLKIKKSVSTTVIIDKDPDYHDYELVDRALTMIADENMDISKPLKMKLKDEKIKIDETMEKTDTVEIKDEKMK